NHTATPCIGHPDLYRTPGEDSRRPARRVARFVSTVPSRLGVLISVRPKVVPACNNPHRRCVTLPGADTTTDGGTLIGDDPARAGRRSGSHRGAGHRTAALRVQHRYEPPARPRRSG